jgi:diadenosine tetraphosphatase ApaH/serine/threonine PP2A family protein phosphatase
VVDGCAEKGRPTEPFCRFSNGDVLDFKAGRRCVINPGGLGQPRDGDTTAPYLLATIDGESVTIEVRRVAYDLEATIAKLQERGYSCLLEEYLRHGTG